MLSTPKRAVWLVPLLAVAVLFRLWLIREFPHPIEGTDAQQYLALAENLVAGNGYSLWSLPPYDADVYRSPGYPLFLALLLKLGLDRAGIIGVQIGLELLTLLLATRLVERVAGARAAVAGLVVGLFCPFTAAIPCLFLSESLALPLVTSLVVLAPFTTTLAGSGAFGAVLGLLALTRGSLLPAIPLAAIFLWYSTGGTRSEKFRHAFTVIICAALVLLPYGAWNLRHHGKLSLTPLAGLGRAMWGGVMMMPGFDVTAPEPAWTIHEAIWRDDTPHPRPSELIAADRALKEVAVAQVRAHPILYLNGVVRHAAHLWIGVRYLFPHGNPQGIHHLLRATSILLFLAGCAGFWRLNLPAPRKLLILAPLIASALVLPWLYVNMRYTSLFFGPLSLMAGAAPFIRNPSPERSGTV